MAGGIDKGCELGIRLPNRGLLKSGLSSSELESEEFFGTVLADSGSHGCRNFPVPLPVIGPMLGS